MELYVKVAKSREGKPYKALILDLGYRNVFLSSSKMSNKELIAEVLGLTIRQVAELEEGEYKVELD